ncbi:hypothetical protein HanLR1_Chr13g0486541 [Helianthus annuus]|nr:hypothetical protein HanLR1_Chr13g0486541 [Helianthus annuus]
MKKRKTLEVKKRELDEQAAAALAAKKSNLQKETPPAPSESEIDMGVFSTKRGNLLEKIYVASAPQGVKSGKASRKTHISKITPPTSPPSRTFGSPPPLKIWVRRRNKFMWKLNKSEKVVVMVQVVLVVMVEASLVRLYIAKPSIPDVHQPLVVVLLREYPGVMSLKISKLDPRILITQREIVREWKLMGEETLEFENDKKAFAEKREKFNAEKKGLLWRVSDAEKKLVQEKQVNSNKQKEWEVACERTNKELQSQRDAIVRLSGEKKKISDEAEEERAAHQKR